MKKQFKVFFSLIFSLVLLFTFSSNVQADQTDSNNNTNQSSESSSDSQSSSKNDQENNTQSSANSQEDKSSSSNKQSNAAQSSSFNNDNNRNRSNSVKTPIKKTPKKANSKKNALPSGWQSKNGKRYYLKNGKPSKGLKKIANYWYLFDRHGVMLKDVRKIPHRNSYGYFDQEGKRHLTNTRTARAYYWIDRNGNITGIKNYARVISQRPNMPTGCEITAVTMMLNFAGVKVSKEQAARIMPRSLNPNKGFIGSPYKNFPLGFWVAPGGVKPVVQHYLGTAKIMTGYSLNSIKKKLLRSHLVVVWVGWFDGFSNHALTLTGYHGNTLYYNDPWTGTKRAMSVQTFERHWALDGHRAISY